MSVRVQVLSNGSLYVSRVFVEDAGKYGCMAGNNGGLERVEAYLHVHSGMTSHHSMKSLLFMFMFGQLQNFSAYTYVLYFLLQVHLDLVSNRFFAFSVAGPVCWNSTGLFEVI